MKKQIWLLSLGLTLSAWLGFGCAGAADPSAVQHREPQRSEAQMAGAAQPVNYLSAAEKQVIAEINKVRANPKAYAEVFISRAKNCDALCREVARRLRMAAPLPPLAPSPELSAAAKELVEKTRLDTVAKSDSGFRQRIEAHGVWRGQIAENISWGYSDPVDIVINLLRSDNAGPDRPYSIINPEFQYAGAALGLHKAFRYMCVVSFAVEIEQRPYEIKQP